MYCPKCGKALPDTAKYCTVCGAEIKFHINSHEYNVSNEGKYKKPKLRRKTILIGVVVAVGCVLVILMVYGGHIFDIGDSTAQYTQAYTQAVTQSTTTPAATENSDNDVGYSADAVSEDGAADEAAVSNVDSQKSADERTSDWNIIDEDLSWVSAYRGFIIGGGYKNFNDVVDSAENPVSFCLYDMNLDGTPELIMSNGAEDYGSSHGIIFSIAPNGNMYHVGNAGYRDISFWHLPDSSDNGSFMPYPGLFHWVGNSGTYDIYYYYIDDYGKLVETQVSHGEEKQLEDGTYTFEETSVTSDEGLYEAYLEGNGINLQMKNVVEIETMSYNSFVEGTLGGFIDYQSFFYDGTLMKILIPWSTDELFTYEPHELSGTSGIYFYDKEDETLLFAIQYSKFPDDLIKQNTFTQLDSIYVKDVNKDNERVVCPIGINRFYLNDGSTNQEFLDNEVEKLLGLIEVRQYDGDYLR